MSYYGVKKFEKLTPILKALWTVVITTLVFEVANADLPTTIEEWKARGPQLGITVALAVLRALQNCWKNRELQGSPFYSLGKYWMLALCVLPLTGCVSMTPALAGKTHYQMDFVDTVQAPEGEAGQNTEFHVKVSAPAGVDVTNLASMNYDWNADNSGKIAVAGDTTADTTAQMAGMVEVNAAQTQAFTQLIQTLAAALPMLTPQAGGSPDVGQPALPTALPTDILGWIAFAREHPELLNMLGGLGR